MIQITLIQIDNYGPWTVTPHPRTESDLQTMQSRLYSDLEREFGILGGLVFFNRFDNLIAVTNGINKKQHERIQDSIRNRYPITISMSVATAATSYEAQKIATKQLQKTGGAQEAKRKEELIIDKLVTPEESLVQIAHIDINHITKTLTDVTSAYDTSIIVYDVIYNLMKELKNVDALSFFIGGDNFMSPSNNVNEETLTKVLKIVDKKTNVTLKAGVGIAKTAQEAADLADIGLEDIRAGLTDKSVLIFNE